jgi:hypothetical protein
MFHERKTHMQEFDENTVEGSAETVGNQQEPITGPIPYIPSPEEALGGWWNGFKGLFKRKPKQHATTQAPVPSGEQQPITIVRNPEPEDDFTRQRRAIEQFTEDYLPLGKRILHGAAKFVGYLLPFIAVIAVGGDLGAFYAPGLGVFSSYLLAYGLECGIAALTVMLGGALSSREKSTAHSVKVAFTLLAWVVISSGSALSLYVMAISNMPHTIVGNLFFVVVGWRVASVSMFDIASVVILFWSGKSLQKHLDELAKKQHGVLMLSEAELSMQRAHQQAQLRRREDEAYMQERADSAARMRQIQQAEHDATMRKLLGEGPNDDSNSRRIGRY